MVILEVGVALVFTLVFLGLSGALAARVFNRPEIGGLILPLSMLSVIGQAAYTVSTSGLIGLGKYDRAALFQVFQGVTKLVVSVGLVLLGFGVAGAVAGYTASFFVSGAIGVALVIIMSGSALPKGLKADLNTGVSYGWPVYLSTLASGFVAPAINTVLALTVSNSQIGGYALATTFSTLIVLFTYPISTVLFPLFSRRFEDYRVLASTYRTSVWFTALLVVPVASFIIAFSSPLMVTFYGRAYAFGASYLTLLASIYLMAGIGSLAWSSLLNGIGHTRDVLVTTAVGSVVSVAAAILLIQGMGVTGAIVGLIFGNVVMVALGIRMVRRRLETALGLASTWKFYLAAALAATICYPLSWLIKTPELSLVAGAIAFLVLFVPFLALLKAMTRDTLGALRSYLGFSPVVSRPLELAIRYYELVARTPAS
jgi:O-antigen/teichoic acid export membrane protein